VEQHRALERRVAQLQAAKAGVDAEVAASGVRFEALGARVTAALAEADKLHGDMGVAHARAAALSSEA
jgi:hypothetical protein